MSYILIPLVKLLIEIIDIYFYIVLASIIVSWLVAFEIVNTRKPFVKAVGEILFRLTEPVLAPIRRFMPDLGPVDISPIVLILGLSFLRNVIIQAATALL